MITFYGLAGILLYLAGVGPAFWFHVNKYKENYLFNIYYVFFSWFYIIKIIYYD